MSTYDRAIALPFALLAACTNGSQVRYVDGQCLINGVATNLAHVEARQAEVTQHVLSRQPLLTAIAVAAVALAGASYIQRILTVLAARRAPQQSFGDRLRVRMERYRAHPVRYFLLLGSVLGTLLVAGVAYVSMDADKRASERSLASLQFCHLALRSSDEQHVLAEQRDNLASIQSTEGDIRALVDKLPPAEQQKAHEIVDQLSSSLGQQRTMVARFAQHADETAGQVERGLSKLADDVVDLKSMLAAMGKLASEVHDVGARASTLGGELESCNARIDALGKALEIVGKEVDGLATRPVPVCPACSCAAPSVPPPLVKLPAPAVPVAAPPTPPTARPTDAGA